MIRALLRFAIPWRLALLVSVLVVAPIALMSNLTGGSMGVFVSAGMLPFLLLCTVLGQPTRRATPFEAGLPISGRQLLLARTLRRLMLVWVPVAALIGLAAVSVGGEPIAPLLGVGEIATLAMLVPQCVRPSDILASRMVAYLCGVVGVGGMLVWNFLSASLALPLFTVAVAVAFLRAWFSVPASYQMAPIGVEGTVERLSRGPRPMLWTTPPSRRLPWWPIVQPAFSGSGFYLLVVAMASGNAYGGPILTTVVCFFPAAVYQFRQRARWMSALPISSRTLLLAALFGAAVPAGVGMAVGLGMRGSMDWSSPTVWFDDGPHARDGTWEYDSKTAATDVTLDLWRLAPGGRAPVIRSPTAETVLPPTMSILGVAVYNPYYVAPTSSDAFLDWQFARATTATYGRPIPRKGAHQGDPAQGPPLTEQPRMLVLSAAMLLMLFLYGVFVLGLSASHRLRRPSARILRWCLLGVAGVPGPAFVAIDLWYTDTAHTAVFVPLVQNLLLRVSAVLPQNLLLVAVIAAVPVVAMYWLLEKQFSGTELIGPLQAGGR